MAVQDRKVGKPVAAQVPDSFDKIMRLKSQIEDIGLQNPIMAISKVLMSQDISLKDAQNISANSGKYTRKQIAELAKFIGHRLDLHGVKSDDDTNIYRTIIEVVGERYFMGRTVKKLNAKLYRAIYEYNKRASDEKEQRIAKLNAEVEKERIEASAKATELSTKIKEAEIKFKADESALKTAHAGRLAEMEHELKKASVEKEAALKDEIARMRAGHDAELSRLRVGQEAELKKIGETARADFTKALTDAARDPARTEAAMKMLETLTKRNVSPTEKRKLSNELLKVVSQEKVDISEISDLIESGADVNFKDEKGNALGNYLLQIHDSKKPSPAETRDAIVSLLISKGSDVNVPGGRPGQNTEGMTPLLLSANIELESTVEILLKAGANPNYRKDEKQLTPLMMAAFAGNIRGVALMLRSGADPRIKDAQGETASDIAKKKGHGRIQDMLKVIVDNYKEKKINTPSQKQLKEAVRHAVSTAFFNAVLADNVGEARLLAEFDIKTLQIISNKRTALMDAVLKNNIEMAKVVLSVPDNVDSINLWDREGLTALMLATQSGYVEMASLLIGAGAGVDRSAFTDNQETALMFAVNYHRKEMISLLLKHGAKVNEKSKDGRTALFYACANGKEEFMEVLIKAGADLNVQYGCEDGQTLLMYAVLNGHMDAANILIKAGADVNRGNKNGVTPLMSSAWNGLDNYAKMLIDAKADVNAKSRDGATALIYAAWGKHSSPVKMLIDAKANINEKTNAGWTALTFAVSEGDVESAKLLINADAKVGVLDLKQPKSSILWELAGNNPALLYLLTGKTVDINKKDSDGCTPLMKAADKGDVEQVKMLLKLKAKLDERNWTRDETALFSAAENNNTEIVKLLVQAGANPNLGRELRGRTVMGHVSDQLSPLMLTCKHGNLEMAELLVKAGAEINAKDSAGWPPLFYAARSNSPKIIRMLVAAGADITVKDEFGITDFSSLKTFTKFLFPQPKNAYDHALELGNKEAAEVLLELSSKPPQKK